MRFALLYGAIFTLAWSFSLFHWTELAVVEVANRQLALIEPAEVSRRLVLEDGGDLVQHLSTGPGTGIFRIASRNSGYVSHNLFLFVALVLASPGLPRRNRFWALGIGLVSIFLLDTLVVMQVGVDDRRELCSRRSKSLRVPDPTQIRALLPLGCAQPKFRDATILFFMYESRPEALRLPRL